MTFSSFKFSEKIEKSITKSGYTSPTLIQSEAIPKILEGSDLRGSAPTGTGKTAAFLLPALQKISGFTTPPKKGPRVLILVPTRELGMQIAVQAEKYSKYLAKVRTVCISGGVPYQKQIAKMKRPYDLLIATPGRLIDFIKQKKIVLSEVELLVLDEADRMLDMGFIEPVEEIIAKTSGEKQTLLFSATFEKSVKNLSDRILKNPVDVIVQSHETKHENIEQKLYYADSLSHKNALLEHFLTDSSRVHTIIFTSTKMHADSLSSELKKRGYEAASLHGDMPQRKRTRTIKEMRDDKIKVLVATDVAARGIDIKSITHVINFDLPRNPEDYVHRIGRTGRAGAKGVALSLALRKDAHLVGKIERFTKQNLETSVVAGLEPSERKPTQKKFSRKRPFFPRGKTSFRKKRFR